jgi:hypothetical protein
MTEDELRDYVRTLRQFRTVAPTLSRKFDEDIGLKKPKKAKQSQEQKMNAQLDALLEG